MLDKELEIYQKNKDPIPLVSKYRKLIVKFAKLSKGIYNKQDSQWRWFYGLFLNGQPRTHKNIKIIEEATIKAMYWLSYTDCYNQSVLFFLELAKRYTERKRVRNKKFSMYIRMMLGFKMKSWTYKHISSHRNLDHLRPAYMSYFYGDGSTRPIESQPFSMNIRWILNGERNPAFHGLSAYDRYILYLYFVEGYSIRTIADKICKSKNTINKDIRRIMTQCRENLKA